MSKLQEKRDYYPDRSVKSIYFVDEQGRKQGNYTEYGKNSDIILSKLEYKDNTVWNGRVETKYGYIEYENGQEAFRHEIINGVETGYKNGKLSSKIWSEEREDGVNCKISQKFEAGNVTEENRTYTFDEDGYRSVFPVTYDCTLCINIAYCDDISVVNISASKSTYFDGEKRGCRWPDIKCKLKDGVLTDFASETMDYTTEWHNTPKKLYAHFVDGKPIGDYCIPLNYDFPFTKRVKDKLYEKIGESITQFSRDSFKSEQGIFNDCFEHFIIAEGSWNEGKFTGKAESIGSDYFEMKWNDGKMQGHCSVRITNTGYDAGIWRNLKWHDDLCDVSETERVKHTDYNTNERVEKYTLKNGKKNGLYVKESFPYRENYSIRERCEYKDDKKNGLYMKEYSPYAYSNEYSIREQCEYKDGKKHGLAKIYNEKGWLESETQYKDGKKHGFEKLYNSDGTVAEMKYWQEGKDCTAKYNKLKKIASKRIDKEKAIEAETGVKTRLPKMSKGAKVVAMVKESLGLSK